MMDEEQKQLLLDPEKEYIDGIGMWTEKLNFKTVADIKRLLENYINRQSRKLHIRYAEKRLNKLYNLEDNFCPYAEMKFGYDEKL